MSNTNGTLSEQFSTISDQIKALKAERAEVARSLRAEGIQADAETRQALQEAVQEAQQTLADLDQKIRQAETHKAALDAAVDRGDDSVDDMELFSAGTAVRRLKGKRKPAEAEASKAGRALEPFLADDRLALLVTDTLETLVDVPVLVRKRAKDVQGIGDAIVLSQGEPTKGYGTAKASGRVRFTEIGTTGLDVEALEADLIDTGAAVNVFGDVIEYDTALWPVTPLIQPSQGAVTEFAYVLERAFDATLKKGGKKATHTYADYETVWHTIEASLDVPEEGKAKGKIVAIFAVDGERPPLYQMQQFMGDALSHFQTGVHTSAGVLDKIHVAEVVDAGLWQTEEQAFIGTRVATQKFGLTLELEFSYLPVEV